MLPGGLKTKKLEPQLFRGEVTSLGGGRLVWSLGVAERQSGSPAWSVPRGVGQTCAFLSWRCWEPNAETQCGWFIRKSQGRIGKLRLLESATLRLLYLDDSDVDEAMQIR